MKFFPSTIDNCDEIYASKISHDIRFLESIPEARKLRKNNMEITQMLWIKKQTVIDSSYMVYNPLALIVLILN
jgi:hypothetical protein